MVRKGTPHPFGRRLHELRGMQRLSLRDLGKAVGTDPTFLSRVERGMEAPPSLDLIVSLARALGQHPRELLILSGRIPTEAFNNRVEVADLRAAQRRMSQHVHDIIQPILNRQGPFRLDEVLQNASNGLPTKIKIEPAEQVTIDHMQKLLNEINNIEETIRRLEGKAYRWALQTVSPNKDR